MEIIIRLDEEGKFSVDKSEKISVFTAVGMLELTKKILLESKSEEADTNETM